MICSTPRRGRRVGLARFRHKRYAGLGAAMGFWHTGYMEHHEDAGLGEDYVPGPVLYNCQHCKEQFANKDELLRHRFEKHPYVTPILLVRGRELGATPIRLSRPIERSDVVLRRCKAARMNGKNVAPARLPGLLAALRNEYVKLELGNDGGSATHEITFSIANEDDVLAVERAFMALARRKALTTRAIDAFIDDCRSYKTAGGYLDGICHYLYGVLAKEESQDSSLAYSDYPDRFNQAADALGDFDRKLAHMIRALIAFHVNQFRDAADVALPGVVKTSSHRFARVLRTSEWPYSQKYGDGHASIMEDLLVDNETRRILRWAEMAPQKLCVEADEISAQIGRGREGLDEIKLKILLVQSHLAAERLVEARQGARRLMGYEATRLMAESIIGRLEQGEV